MSKWPKNYERTTEDSETTQTVVIAVIVVSIFVVLSIASILIFLFRNRIRRAYRRWRLETEHERAWAAARDVSDHGVPAQADVALQLQLYALEINNANDGSDHVALVFPGLLSAMGPQPPRVSSRARGDDGTANGEDGSEDGDEARRLRLAGMPIAFGAGASTSLAHSTTTTTTGTRGLSLRNPLSSQATPQRSRVGGGAASFALQARTSLAALSTAGVNGVEDVAIDDANHGVAMGEVMVPTIAFSLGYGGDEDNEEEEQSVFMYNEENADRSQEALRGGASHSGAAARRRYSLRRGGNGDRSSSQHGSRSTSHATSSTRRLHSRRPGGLRSAGVSVVDSVTTTEDEHDDAHNMSRNKAMHGAGDHGEAREQGSEGSQESTYGSGCQYVPQPDQAWNVLTASSRSSLSCAPQDTEPEL